MFDWLFGEEKSLGPVMGQAVESGIQALPDEVQLKAWMGRERRQREDTKQAEEELFSGFSDADEAQRARVYEEQHDRCMTEEEQRAAIRCLKGALPGHAAGTDMTPEMCMEARRDGVAVTGGSSTATSSRTTTDGTSGSESLEMAGGVELGPVPKATVGGKGNVTRGRMHSDAVTGGDASTESWQRGAGYMATCDAEARRAEDAVASVQKVTRRR